MAYAAVISLKNTIERLLYSSRILLVPPSPEIMISAYNESKLLQEILKRLDSSSKSNSRERVNALDGQIKEAVWKFEDLLESHVSNQIAHSQSESYPLLFSIDLQGLGQDVDSFVETVKKMEEQYIYELDNPIPEENDDEDLSSRIGFDGKKSKMVGLSDHLSQIRHDLTWVRKLASPVFSLVGMAGIGKTAIAKEIFEDPLILSHFECRAWVTVGRKSQLNEIARGILAQVDPDTEKMLTEGDDKIAWQLYTCLEDRRYLIVLDDVWDTQVLNNLRKFLSDNKNGSRVLLTTRLQEVAVETYTYMLKIRLLRKEESWDLLREKVFGEELCPPQLEKAGKKIAENCEGLPLLIVTVADLLSKAEKTLTYWNKVAEKQNSVFKVAYDEISKVLFPSYEYLPQHLKPCFLYMGVFPQNYEIPKSRLINMWSVEGFLEPNMTQTLEDCAEEYLLNLVSNSLILCRKATNWFVEVVYCMKTFRLHSSLWYLCNREARKNKFSHTMERRADGLEAAGINCQRRLCIHNNILFGIKDAYNSMEANCASTARSLLCFGSYQQYSVPICFGLRLLRVIDALKIRFYEFPMEVLKLVQLRFLALTYNGKLPAAISKLWNLEFLIIHRHLSIKSCGAPSYVPIEIWDMQELKHLQVMGNNLPNSNCGTSLKKLLTLLGVSANNCTKGVLRRIPALKKLGIQIDLMPDDDDDKKYFGHFRCLNRISRLRKLESLKCVLMNPELRSKFVAPPAPRSMFPLSLRKLHLSGMGYPWEYMSIIASLPNLEVLKLRCYAFRGPKWEVEMDQFSRLHILIIEDTDLMQWKMEHGSFPWLRRLSIKHCYKLEELPMDWFFRYMIEVVDCNPLAVTWAKQKEEAFRDVDIDGNLKS